MINRQPYEPPSPLTSDVRVRLPLPLVVPFGALLVIALVTIGFSRVLLAVPKEAATVLALAMAANVLAACAFLASERGRRASLAELAMVVLYPLVIGIVIAQIGFGDAAPESAGERPEAAAAGAGLAVAAQQVAFDTAELHLPAEEEATIHFENKDTVQHNIAIYEDDSAQQSLFQGEIIDGGETVDYAVPPVERGKYYFQCDVHPNMNGSVTVQ